MLTASSIPFRFYRVIIRYFPVILFVVCTIPLHAEGPGSAQDKLEKEILKEYGFLPDKYQLQIQFKKNTQDIKGVCIISVRAFSPDVDTLKLDLAEGLHISQAGGLKVLRQGNRVLLFGAKALERIREKKLLTIRYSGSVEKAKLPPWSGGIVLAHDANNKAWMSIACQLNGASIWWPCVDVWGIKSKGFTSEYKMRKPEAGAGFTANNAANASAGKLKSLNKKSGTFQIFSPVSTYQITFQYGRYAVPASDTFRQADGNVLALGFAPLAYHEKEYLAYWSVETKKMLRAFEYYFGGFPFPEDGFSIVETSYWGMEHQSAMAYGNKLEKNAYGFDFILVHEAAHQWWGNAVTACRQDEMWIHESFATYAETLYVEFYQGKKKAEEYLMGQRKNVVNRSPMVGRNSPEARLRDNDIYYKGALMLAEIRKAWQNDTAFFRWIASIPQRFKNTCATTAEIELSLNEAGYPFSSSIVDYYTRHAQLPRLFYSADTTGGRRLISLQWEAWPGEQVMRFPVFLRLGNEEKRVVVSSDQPTVLQLKNENDRLYFRRNYFFDIETSNVIYTY